MPEVVSIATSLDPETEARCAERLRIARTHMAAGFYHWIEAGKQFAANKTDLSGSWATWCRNNAVARTTADQMIQVYERFGTTLTLNVSADTSRIDLDAARLLASPSVPQALAEEALARAAAGERISRAEAERMVERAKAAVQAEAEQTLAEQRRTIIRDARARAAEQIAQLEGQITEDATERRALKRRLKELDEIVSGRRQPDLADIERVMSRFSGRRSLSKTLVQSIAKEVGRPIDYNGVTYPPIDPSETRAKEEKLLRWAALGRALSYYVEAPSVDDLLAEADHHDLNRLRNASPLALRWLTELSDGLRRRGG